MPYATPIRQRDGSTMIYDSGDYPESQRRALDACGWTNFPARQAAARKAGRHLGLGLANYVEGTGRGPFESAGVRVGGSGRIVVTTGASAQGQGVKTMLSQLVSDVLGVPAAGIDVITGDTAGSALGFGAFASRQTVTAGNAVHLAAIEVRDKAIKAAAELMEASAGDLELVNGTVRVKGVPQMNRSLGEIARVIGGVPGAAILKGVTPGLAAAIDFPSPALTYCNGTHCCEVEVDAETGAVHIIRYVLVHDAGRIINPMIVDGQVQGAVAHGIGAALTEWMRYDGGGQPQTVTYGDYLLPTIDTVPGVEIHHMESPTPLNPLGVKGATESGTIAAPAAIASAVEDALKPFGVRVRDLPITPERIVALIRANANVGG
jgi:carbon-monoxide dehydrogenase large subunit